MSRFENTVPSLIQKNIHLQKKIKSLKEINATLRKEVSELLNTMNQNPQQQMLPQTEKKSDDYLYFHYKQQIKQKLQQIKQLQEKCSKIYYQTTIKSSDQMVVDIDDEESQINGDEQGFEQRNIKRQHHERRVERDIEDNEQGINGKKMLKKQALQRKKKEKKTLPSNGNSVPRNRIEQEIINEQSQISRSRNRDSAFQNEYFQNLLPPLQFLKDILTEEQISSRYNYKASDHSLDRHLHGVKNHLDLSNKQFSMSRFLRHDWRNIEKMQLNICKLTTEDWNLFCDHHNLFKNLKTLSLAQNLIKKVKGEQIENFPSLLVLNFGIDSCGKPNPLTFQTKSRLQQWEKQRKNPNLLLLYKEPKDNTNSRSSYFKPIQSPAQLRTKILKQTQCLEYLRKVFTNNYNLLGHQYGPILNNTKIVQEKNKGVKYSENAFYLIHNFKQPEMQDFIKANWYEFEQMRFCNSRFTDQDWQIFTANAQQYPHLKSLILNGNFIKEVRFEELEKLKELKYLEIEGNNLSERSICDIEQYKEKHKDVTILY